MPRFKVFGRNVAIERQGNRWACFHTGTEGRRRPVELAVPSDVAHAELAHYLYDIFQKSATPTNGDVVEVDAEAPKMPPSRQDPS